MNLSVCLELLYSFSILELSVFTHSLCLQTRILKKNNYWFWCKILCFRCCFPSALCFGESKLWGRSLHPKKNITERTNLTPLSSWKQHFENNLLNTLEWIKHESKWIAIVSRMVGEIHDFIWRCERLIGMCINFSLIFISELYLISSSI